MATSSCAASSSRAISAHYASAACRYLEGMSPIGKGRPYVLVKGHEHAGCI